MRIQKNWYIKSLLLLVAFLPLMAAAQNGLAVKIKQQLDSGAIQHAMVTIEALNVTFPSDENGFTQLNLPKGINHIKVSATGYEEQEKIITMPMAGVDTLIIFLVRDEQILDELTISSTRSNRSFLNTPTRVEVLAAEEINEEASMRPGDIRMMLAESTGIQTQQTSAVTGNASIRIQGLDGRYTQILKDGFPVYAGAASGLGLLQTPPLDLKQVEIIKGSTSPLYGGGAIAGLVNLISKTPGAKRELNFLVNVTTAGGRDINGFYSQRFHKVGLTLYASRNSNKAYDPAGISFSAIPKFERYTLNPKVFIYFSNKTKLALGLNTGFENRIGGDMMLIRGYSDSVHSFFERNKTQRASSQFTLDHKFNENSIFNLKNSVSFYRRRINSKGYNFEGVQLSTFTEATWSSKHKGNDFVAGVNVLGDEFKEPNTTAPQPRNYRQNTLGIFVQETCNAAPWLIIETGLRGDYMNGYGTIILPRVSAVFKILPKFTSRLGAGWGYKAPSIFTEETERLLYRNVLPISTSSNVLEKSLGANLDFDYKFSMNELSFSINQLFFYTKLRDPLAINDAGNNNVQLQNIDGSIYTKGAETNIKVGYDELALYMGYTYTNAQVHEKDIRRRSPLTPKHRFNAALVYELEGKWKFGSELYYFNSQELNDGRTGRGYWLSGLIAEKLWKRFSVFINFENFADVRQTRFESIYTGTVTNPIFKDIYAPLEGFVVNGGIKLKL